jgi:hypothetical protein
MPKPLTYSETLDQLQILEYIEINKRNLTPAEITMQRRLEKHAQALKDQGHTYTTGQPFINPGKLYDKTSVEGIVIRLTLLVQDFHQADLADPQTRDTLKKRAVILSEQSRGKIIGPIT